jgi:hypothetical protein
MPLPGAPKLPTNPFPEIARRRLRWNGLITGQWVTHKTLNTRVSRRRRWQVRWAIVRLKGKIKYRVSARPSWDDATITQRRELEANFR